MGSADPGKSELENQVELGISVGVQDELLIGEIDERDPDLEVIPGIVAAEKHNTAGSAGPLDRQFREIRAVEGSLLGAEKADTEPFVA